MSNAGRPTRLDETERGGFVFGGGAATTELAARSSREGQSVTGLTETKLLDFFFCGAMEFHRGVVIHAGHGGLKQRKLQRSFNFSFRLVRIYVSLSLNAAILSTCISV